MNNNFSFNNNFNNIIQTITQSSANNLNNNNSSNNNLNFNNNFNNNSNSNLNFSNNFNNININNFNFEGNFNNNNLKNANSSLLNKKTNKDPSNADSLFKTTDTINNKNLKISNVFSKKRIQNTVLINNSNPSNAAVFKATIIDEKSNKEIKIGELDAKMNEFINRINSKNYDKNLFNKLIENYNLEKSRVIDLFEKIKNRKILNSKKNFKKNKSKRVKNIIKAYDVKLIKAFNKHLKTMQEILAKCLKIEAKSYENNINDMDFNYYLKIDDDLVNNNNDNNLKTNTNLNNNSYIKYIKIFDNNLNNKKNSVKITDEDLDEDLNLNLENLRSNKEKTNSKEEFTIIKPFNETEMFKYLAFKTKDLENNNFNSNHLNYVNETQRELYYKIVEALINAKKAYYNLGDLGFVDEDGNIINTEAKKEMKSFGKKLYNLLKKLCNSLNVYIFSEYFEEEFNNNSLKNTNSSPLKKTDIELFKDNTCNNIWNSSNDINKPENKIVINNNINYNEITEEDLNKILTISFKSLDLGPIITDEKGHSKKCLLFNRTKMFSYIYLKFHAIKQKFFNDKSLFKRNEIQIKLFNNIKMALINAKDAYYDLNDHGFVDGETGTITNSKARKIMEEFSADLYILLKKLCASLGV